MSIELLVSRKKKTKIFMAEALSIATTARAYVLLHVVASFLWYDYRYSPTVLTTIYK